MNKRTLSVILLAVLIGVPFVLQLACGGKDPLNSNDQAHVASAPSSGTQSKTVQANSNTAASNANTAGAAAPAATPLGIGTPSTTIIMHKPTREEVDKDQERYRQMAAADGSKIGNGPNDTWLWVETRFELVYRTGFPVSNIKVDVDNGVVTLRGTVLSAQHRDSAEALVRGIEGVESVDNKLTIAPE